MILNAKREMRLNIYLIICIQNALKEIFKKWLDTWGKKRMKFMRANDKRNRSLSISLISLMLWSTHLLQICMWQTCTLVWRPQCKFDVLTWSLSSLVLLWMWVCVCLCRSWWCWLVCVWLQVYHATEHLGGKKIISPSLFSPTTHIYTQI